MTIASMMNFERNLIFLFCFFATFLTCYASRVKKNSFELSRNKRIANNHLYSLKTRDATECGMKCSEDDRCSAATYYPDTYVCWLHFARSSKPLRLFVKNGVVTLTKKVVYIPIDIRFDNETLHRDMFMSSDGTVLSNSLSTRTVRKWPTGNNQLMNYRGAITDYCVIPGQKIYYEFRFDFERSATSQNLVAFHFGVADISTINNETFCGSANVDGWSFFIVECDETLSVIICITAWRNGTKEYEVWMSGFNIGTTGTYAGIYALILDRVDNSFSLFYKGSQRSIYTHTNVLSDADLCPVFGIGDLSNSTVTLQNASEILTTPL